MTNYIHRHQDRGYVQAGWLNTYHSFSFGQWYDPRFLGISSLRVINDDRIAAHQGFGTHPHKNMEILTYVLKGTITHKDSMGNHGAIRAGEWQLMSAGSGIQHSEVNQEDEPVHLLQIWLHPNVQNATPQYQQIKLNPIDDPNKWHLIASPTQGMQIRQTATIKASFLSKEKNLALENEHGLSYLHVIEGKIEIDNKTLTTGDAIAISEKATVYALEESHLIWFDLTDIE